MQEGIIIVLFAASVFYLGRLVYSYLSKPECASGCGKCATKSLDLDKIERDFNNKYSH